mmetsp:Transcript_10408/g.18203  ORF Transcript_10408/g.18203 Transcript_10408/m.18203 type:complete len:348 (-) Transcript_10408:443-1486(-)
MAPPQYSMKTKLTAFAGLVAVQTAVGVIYRASQKVKGHYEYSPASALTLAETAKFIMSFCFHLASVKGSPEAGSQGALPVAMDIFWRQANLIMRHSFGLACLYCFNNNAAFLIFIYADPGNISLMKSGSSFISAILLALFFKRGISKHGWAIILLQVFGLIIVEWDPVKGAPVLPPEAYLLVLSSVLVTSICGVWNEHMIKTFAANLHVQNMVLYFFGAFLNLGVYLFMPSASDISQGFFHGYDLLAFGVICCNAFMGLAVTAIYKYADVLIKTFASASTTGLLIFLSAIFFDLHPNLITVCGSFVVFIATYLYFTLPGVQLPPPQPVKVSAPPPDEEAQLLEKGKN